MHIRKIFYSLKQGIKNIGRNKLFSLASVGTIAACIFLIGMFYAIVVNFQYIVEKMETQVGISVFFDEGTEQDQIDAIGEKLKSRSEVLTITFISADEAWEEFQVKYFADAPELAEGFKDDNPLADSASYEIFLNDITKQEEFVEYAESISGVRTVKYSEGTVSTLTDFGKLVGYVSIAIIIVLLAIGIFLISNTVMIGITVRKEEIHIMKLIGATNSFVRAPFVVEGLIIGIIGAVIPLGILALIYRKVISYIVEQFRTLTSLVAFLPTRTVFATLIPIALAVGAGIGLIGSFISIRKHLKI